jgi:hypothetical protein
MMGRYKSARSPEWNGKGGYGILCPEGKHCMPKNLFAGTALRLYTPWGRAQNVQQLESGVYVASTDVQSFGIILADTVARRRLTESARRRAQPYGKYFCYSQFSTAILAWEITDLCPMVCQRLGFAVDEVAAQRTYIFLMLSRHHADYLMDVGVKPEENNFAAWKLGNREREMLADRDPNMITWADPIPGKRRGVLRVHCADGSSHLVTQASYDRLPKFGLPYLLSRCERIENG